MKSYYDQKSLWDRALTGQEKQRVKVVEKFIPDDVETILDAGCGNGTITNHLYGYDITAADRSEEALKYVKHRAVQAEIEHLPFADDSFDLVLCSDVLEHLPNDIYEQALSELKRVARKYILILSPNEEDLRANQSQCHKCATVFHMNWHLRSLSVAEITANFHNAYVPLCYGFFGDEWASEPEVKYTIARQTGRGYKHWGNAVCPLCGTQQQEKTDEIKDLDRRCNVFLRGFFNRSTEFALLLSTMEESILTKLKTRGERDILLTESPMTELKFVNRRFIDFGEKTFFMSQTRFYPRYAYTVDSGDDKGRNNRQVLCFPCPEETSTPYLYLEYKDNVSAMVRINIYDARKSYLPLGKVLFTGDGKHHSCRFEIPAEITVTNEGMVFEIVPEGKIPFADLGIRQAYLDGNTGTTALTQRKNTIFLNREFKQYSYGNFRKNGDEFLLTPPGTMLYDHDLGCFYLTLSDTFEFFNKTMKETNEAVADLQKEMEKAYLSEHVQTARLAEIITAQERKIGIIRQRMEADYRARASKTARIIERLEQLGKISKNRDELRNMHVARERENAGFSETLHAQAREIQVLKSDLSELQQELYRVKEGMYTVSNTVDNLLHKLRRPWRMLPGIGRKRTPPKKQLKHFVVITPDVRIDRRTVQMCQSLINRLNVRCTIVAALDSEDNFVSEHLKVHRINPAKSKKHRPALGEWAPGAGIDLETFYWLHSHYVHAGLQEKPDYLMCCDLPVLPAGVCIAKLAGVPLVYDAHELYPEQAAFAKEKRAFLSRVEKTCIRHPDLVITVNESIAEEMSRRYAIQKPKVLLNAVDAPDNFDISKSYDHFRRKLPIEKQQKIVLFQGGYARHRNLEIFIESAKLIKNRNVVLVLMGFGDLETELMEIAKKNRTINKNVFFIPAVDPSVLLEYSASADVGIIPYPHTDLNSYYCTPNKLFEFIQAGLPVLANDSPELNRFVKGLGIGNCRKIENAGDIAQMIDEFFEQERDYRAALIEAVNRISWKIEEHKFIDALREILS